MDKNKIIEQLISMLNEMQELLGEEAQQISSDTKPIGGVGGFTSLTGVMFTCNCIDGFGLPEDRKLQSIVVGQADNGKCFARTVEQIADDIAERLVSK